MSAKPTVVAHVPNLFDRARFGRHVVFVDTGGEAAAHEPTTIMVDLDRCADPAEFRLDGPVVIGFGSHVDSAGHQRARDLGYDLVLPRSQFFRRLPHLLTTSEPDESDS